MHDKAMRLFGAMISSLVCGAFVACAGSATPTVDDTLEDAILQTYGSGAVAGGSAMGRAGSSAAPTAGRGGTGTRPPPSNAGAGGAASVGGGGAASGGAGECDGFALLVIHCGGPTCHGAGTTNGNFAESLAIAENFADADPVTPQCASDGPVLNPDNPPDSLLIQKVNGTVPCGTAMPLGASLSDADISCLEEWIGTL
jgi:hypothetical protein